MKKWWMIAVVFALALSLTSCSRRRPDGLLAGSYGLNYCDGSIGNIDVYTIAVKNAPGTYKVVLIPIALDQPGDIVTVAVANSSSLAHKVLVEQVVVYTDQEIVAGYLSENELNDYDRIAISMYTPGVPWAQANAAKDAICQLPLIGDGI